MTVRPPDRRVLVSVSPPDVALCVHPDCEADADQDAPTPLCQQHLRLVFAHVMGSAELQSTVAEPYEPLSPTHDVGQGWVYFIRIGAEVKIGYTANPPHRFRTLRPDEVLHLQHGTMQDERRCHAAFQHLRTHGEFFRPEPDLLAFIEGLRATA